MANIFKSTGHPLFNQMRSESSEMIDESEEGSGSGSSWAYIYFPENIST